MSPIAPLFAILVLCRGFLDSSGYSPFSDSRPSPPFSISSPYPPYFAISFPLPISFYLPAFRVSPRFSWISRFPWFFSLISTGNLYIILGSILSL